MKFQQSTYTCGPASIRNALRALGKKVSELKVRQYSSTTKEDGTNPECMCNAIAGLGYVARDFSTYNSAEAINWLTGALANSQPIILSVDDEEHWIVSIGRIGDRFILIDSTRTKANKAENGVHVVSKRQLLKRWKSKAKEFYGIAVSKS